MPEKWLRYGSDLTGLIVARPLQFDSKAHKNVKIRNATYLLEVLPRLCSDAALTALQAHSGTAYLFTADKYCLVVIALKELGLELRLKDMVVKNVPEDLWFSAFHGDHQKLAELLQLAGLGDWTEKALEQVESDRVVAAATLVLKAKSLDQERVLRGEVLRFVGEMQGKGITVTLELS